jgi:hypothetical protein
LYCYEDKLNLFCLLYKKQFLKGVRSYLPNKNKVLKKKLSSTVITDHGNFLFCEIKYHCP